MRRSSESRRHRQLLHFSELFSHVAPPMTATPNHALQRTPGFGVQLPGAALIRPAQSRAVRPAMKPGTARAFALRRRILLFVAAS